MAHKTVEIILGADVADTGTVTLPYPPGTNQASFTGRNASADGVVVVNDNDVYAEDDPGIGLTYGVSNITLTNNTEQTWTAGSRVIVELGMAGGGVVNVVQQPAFADLTGGQSPTEAEFNALLQTLRNAGVIAS